MQTPNNVGNGAAASRDSCWNQVHSTNMLQNTTPPVWNELPPDSVPSVPGSTINPTRGINPQFINGQNILPTQNGQIIGGPGCSNQSAFRRFITQPPAWSSKKTTGEVKKQKRIRTAFTSQQMMHLEQEYARIPYLDRARRIELADFLSLNERTIMIWFQNRRMKEKKVRTESTESPHPVCHCQGNNYVEQYPPVTIADSMPGTSLPTLAPVLNSVQSTNPTVMSEEEFKAQYQQVQLQMQPYQPPYTEVQQLSSELEPRTDSPTPSAPSAIIEESSDLPWLRFSLDL